MGNQQKRSTSFARLWRDINLFITHNFIPAIFIKYVQEDRLKEVVSICKLKDSEEVMIKKSQIKFLIKQVNIILNLDDK